MNVIEIIHGKHEKQASNIHSHDQHEHSHGRSKMDQGLRLMRLLGIFIQFFAHNSDWMSNYRSKRLIPASNKVIIGTIVALLIGVALWHMLPAGLTVIGLGIFLAASSHLAVIVIVGLVLSLFIRRQRETARQAVIGSIPWQGNEKVLDVGCGTGMLLNACAKKLITGKATGIDLWQQDVAGSTGTLMQNAQAEGVANKVEYQEMDARHLTFNDASFNVVVSSFALHHISTQSTERVQAIAEMIRVLAPNGLLSLVDVGAMLDVAEPIMAQYGLKVTQRKQTRFFRVVTARKA